MNKRVTSMLLSLTVASSICVGFAVPAQAAAKAPQYQEKARLMEKLDRGLIATYVQADGHAWKKAGVYLSWRLFGTEKLEDQAFDIYKNGTKLITTGAQDATNYVDESGTANDKYKVVKKDATEEEVAAEKEVTPGKNYTAKGSEVTNKNSEINSFTYFDVPIQRPEPVERMGDGKLSYYYTLDKDHEGGANDASVGDLDGDGDYEIILKWEPTDQKDSAGSDFTGNTYIDAYQIDPNAKNYMWRIDLGKNVTAGAHYTQFMVFDFDGDGKSEVAMQTAPGSKDGKGEYVSRVGDSAAIRDVDNEKSYMGTSGRPKGKNMGPEYLTIFNGATGEAMATTDFIPLGTSEEWGDAKYNRAERFLAAVAYLDGVHPSLIICRGYYNKAVIRAYSWDGDALGLTWEYDSGTSARDDSLYGQGNHNLSIADIDNDGCDEIVYGSACLDHDGKTVMGNTKLEHGDAMHVNDFNNDGKQEVFSVKEEQFKKEACSFRVAETGKKLFTTGTHTASSDTGRGVMDNIDDAYALKNPTALSLAWDSAHATVHDLTGADLKAKPSKAGSGTFDNFLVFWDGDLSRELLDANIIQKYNAETGTTRRFYGPTDGYTLTGATTNNFTKRTPSLVADIWGDWREEVIMPVNKASATEPAALRVFTSTLPTDYRLTTLMHDSQYRTSVAWQNVAYNQPTHTSYYVGSVALATNDSGENLNYLAPATKYTNVVYEIKPVPVTGITMEETSIRVEKGESETVNAAVVPSDATKKDITWTSSNDAIATVANGIVKGVSDGTVTITATTKENEFTAQCEVTVYSNPTTGITLSDKSIELGVDYTATLKAQVLPDEATDKSVKWTSENPYIATVSDDGVVTGVSYGKTKITATTVDGGFTQQCRVNVKPLTITDINDENPFVSSNTDAETTFEGSPTGGILRQDAANTGAEFQKSFKPYNKDKATISYKLVTGGLKDAGGNWNWDGREYSFGVKILDTEGNNILELSQAYRSKGETLMSKVGENDAKAFDADWKANIAGIGNIQGSAKRWWVTLEFDYEEDTCTAVVSGCDSSWAETAKYSKTFSLNGANFETLQYYTTKDGEGGISVSPTLSDVSYTHKTTATGNTSVLYEKGSQETAWVESDLTDWVQTGTDTAALVLDSENGRIWYNPTKPAAEYSAKKTFETVDNSLVTYDVDWYFGSATGRDTVAEYIQFGSALRIGWTSGYVTWVSTDGGTTWNDNDADEIADSIFNGENTTYTKNIRVVFDKATNTIKSFKFDGKTIDAYTDYVLPEGATADSVSFGLQRGGATAEWPYINGIERIRVSEFVEGIEFPDETMVEVTDASEKTIDLSYFMLDDAFDFEFIGALYKDDMLLEVKSKAIEEPTANEFLTDSLTFENDVTDCTIKVFMWKSLENMEPVTEPATYVKGEEPTPTVEPTDTPGPTGTVEPIVTNTPDPVETTEPTDTPELTSTPEPTPIPTPTAEPTPVPTLNPNIQYEPVFESADNFLMVDNVETNKWIVSSDGFSKETG